jgi:hypothetical protein
VKGETVVRRVQVQGRNGDGLARKGTKCDSPWGSGESGEDNREDTKEAEIVTKKGRQMGGTQKTVERGF